MPNKSGFFLLLTATAALTLGGCSGTKEKMGLTKKSPDEFAVVKRAPLSMPPDYSLRPPTPGAPRPQEQSPQQEARQTVFGTSNTVDISGSDSTFLTQAGAAKADPSIRRKVDSETAILNEKERPVIKRVLGMNSPEQAPASVVDAKQEAERLKTNKEKGKPVTDGETPSLER